MRLIRQESHSSGVKVDFFLTDTGQPYVITRFAQKCPQDIRQAFKSLEKFINREYLAYSPDQNN